MKISNDLDYMILMDNEKNIYILNNNDNNQEPKKKNNSNNNINNLNQKCLYCDRELTNDGLNSSLIQVNLWTFMEIQPEHLLVSPSLSLS